MSETIKEIPLDKLHPFPDHPFGVRDDDAMQQTVESIKEYGVLVPAIARPREEGGYELVAGHRRKHACELAGLKTMPVIVRELDRNAATIIMVDSNLQRENILPSERAKAYKMKLEAIKRQAGRPSKNSVQVGQNYDGKTSREIIAENSPDSSSQIRRYIRLNELEPELQKLVDDGKIGMTPAMEISYLKPDEQKMLIETIDSEQATPSLSQAQRMKRLSQEGKLNDDTMLGIMMEQKKPENWDLKLPMDKIRKFFPRSYTPQRMEETIMNKERLKDITDSIERGIQDLFQSDKYAEYLRTMSRFHKYSVNNTMLIYMQKPDATLVAGFNKWRDQFERNVMKGEKGIKIIAPTPYKKKIEQEKRDPDTNLPMLDADGKVITEEKEIKIPMFKPVTVFDVSQTDGKPLPQLASNLTGDVQNFDVFMEALRRTSPVPIDIKPIADGADGFFSLDNQRITIREGMSEVQTVSAVVHEIAHSKLHNQKKIEEPKNATKYQEVEIFDIPALFSNGRIATADIPEGLYRYDLRGSDYDPGMPVTVENNVMVNHAGSILTAKPLELGDDGRLILTEDEGLNFVGGEISAYQFLNEQRKDRNTEEVEAESVSFAVCAYYGIATGENSFGYIATWSKDKELKELTAKIAEAQNRLAEVNVLKNHIINYSKTKDVYVGYRKSGYSKKYLDEHESDIVIHRSAKNAFDELGVKKLPTIKSLQVEFAERLNEKKSAYAELKKVRDELRDLAVHTANYEELRDLEEREKRKETEHGRD